jgi:glyoxylase-like metal-dependent hydrolase (beta-lactamase superfamily II)
MMSGLSRRDLLKSMAVGTASLGTGLAFNWQPAAAQAEGVASAIFRFNVGALELTVISDGRFGLDTTILGTNAEEGAVDELLAANFLPTGTLPNAVQFLLLNSGDSLTLLDTGRGAGNGQVLTSLNTLGIAPEDINNVVISHFHVDHIGGVATEGQPTFPNAQVWFPQPEWDFLQENSANEGLQGALGALQAVADADQLDFYADEQEIVSGVQAVSTPGHTPGHMSLLISSNGEGHTRAL